MFVTFSRTDFVIRGFAISLVSRASSARCSLFFLGIPNSMPEASGDSRLVVNSVVNYDTSAVHPKLNGPSLGALNRRLANTTSHC